MARTVRGAALLLGAMQTTSAPGDVDAVDVGNGERSNLLGLRLGVVRDYSGAGDHPEVEAAFGAWLQMLREAGAELVDPVKLDLPSSFNAAVLEVLLYEFKAGIEQYLAAAHVEPATLEALIRYNETYAVDVMPYFGQELFIMARARGGLDEPAYRQALAESQGVMRARPEQLLGADALDALVAPVNAPAWTTDRFRGDRGTLSSSSIAAVSGYPSIAVPAGLIGNLPVGVAFVGPPWSEGLLVEIAAVFERTRGPMPAPTFMIDVER
jgi:amidase